MKRIFFISIIGLALFSGACSKKNNPAAEQYQKAEELYGKGIMHELKLRLTVLPRSILGHLMKFVPECN